MTIAELHGKLSSESADDRSEDLLTSDVFGTMRYLAGGEGFLNWFASAKAPVQTGWTFGTMAALLEPTRVVGIRYAFWPMLPNGREPDVCLLVSLRDADPLLICIEAKYFSGMSD